MRQAGIQNISFKGAANISIRFTEMRTITQLDKEILRSTFETLDPESKDLDLTFYQKEWPRLPDFL